MLIEIPVLLGFAGIIITLVGGVVARDRALVQMMHDNHEQVTKSIASVADRLDERVSRVREEMNNHYVKRADLDGHLTRLERSLSEIKAEAKEDRRETNKRLDAVLAAVKGA